MKVTATPGPTFTEAGFNADGVPTTQLVTPVLADGVTTEWKEDLGLRNPVIPPPHGEPNPINGEFSDTPKYEVVKKVCIGHQGKWIKVATASVKSDGHYLHHNGADIIPPFTMETLGADRTLGLYWNFEGQQWNSENQALHAEGCKDKGEEPKPDPTDPTDPVDPQPNPDPEGPKNPQPEGPKNPEGPTPNNPENPGKDDKDPVKDGGKGDDKSPAKGSKDVKKTPLIVVAKTPVKDSSYDGQSEWRNFMSKWNAEKDAMSSKLPAVTPHVERQQAAADVSSEAVRDRHPNTGSPDVFWYVVTGVFAVLAGILVIGSGFVTRLRRSE